MTLYYIQVDYFCKDFLGVEIKFLEDGSMGQIQKPEE